MVFEEWADDGWIVEQPDHQSSAGETGVGGKFSKPNFSRSAGSMLYPEVVDDCRPRSDFS